MTIKALAVKGVMLMSATMAGAQTIYRKVEAKKTGFDVTAKVPVFADKTPVAMMSNAAMMTWVKKAQAGFLKETEPPFKDSVVKLYTWGATPTVHYYYAPRLASVSFVQGWYTGGNHPNFVYYTFNYGVIDGKAKKLTLTDVFSKRLSAADIKQQVNDLILNKLRLQDRASFVVDGSIAKLSEAQLNRFVLTREGMTFLFPPYELASYAAGDFKVELSLSELGPDFRRALILAR